MLSKLVSLQNISVRHQTQDLLSNVSLDILKDEHLAIIGKSGSGKSILLKVIAGLQGVTGGFIDYDFKKKADHGEGLVKIAQRIVLVDNRHHFKNKSNTTDLYYQQRFNSFDADDTPTVANYLSAIPNGTLQGYWTIEKVLDRLAIRSIYDKELIKLSNGETKRLRLASALLKNPELLLLDYPLTGLDVNARESFNLLLDEIANSGITIVMATSPIEIPEVISKVVWLDGGKIKSIESPGDIIQNQLNWQDNYPSVNEKDIALFIQNKGAFTYGTFIKMIHVNVKYGNKTILKNINWEVKQGERWALLGHNGAGKSTLLSLIYGDNPQAYANNIVLFDKKRGSGESIWDIKRRCGFVSPELFQYFPVDNNCVQVIESGFYDTLGLFRQSESSRSALALKWMEVLGIRQYSRQPLKNIPASAQRLCLLARAMVKNPDLLILDEPCQGLDEQQKVLFKSILDSICRQSNLTLIYVTHYVEELPDAVDNYLKLEEGQLSH